MSAVARATEMTASRTAWSWRNHLAQLSSGWRPGAHDRLHALVKGQNRDPPGRRGCRGHLRIGRAGQTSPAPLQDQHGSGPVFLSHLAARGTVQGVARATGGYGLEIPVAATVDGQRVLDGPVRNARSRRMRRRADADDQRCASSTRCSAYARSAWTR
jgi:hypothetical protein